MNNEDCKVTSRKMLSASQSGPKPKQNPNVKINTTNMIHLLIHQTQLKRRLFSAILGTVGDLTSSYPMAEKCYWRDVKTVPCCPTKPITKILMAWKIEVGS